MRSHHSGTELCATDEGCDSRGRSRPWEGKWRDSCSAAKITPSQCRRRRVRAFQHGSSHHSGECFEGVDVQRSATSPHWRKYMESNRPSFIIESNAAGTTNDMPIKPSFPTVSNELAPAFPYEGFECWGLSMLVGGLPASPLRCTNHCNDADATPQS